MKYFEEDLFYSRYPQLAPLKAGIRQAADKISQIRKPNKIMVCGNGGSCADSLHIVGELMKEFRMKRPVDDGFKAAYTAKFSDGFESRLQGAIPAISLQGESSLISAVINDVGADLIYAQQVYGLGSPGDILIGLSTSGNSLPVKTAFQAAKALNITTIGFTGKTGGKIAPLCDILLNVDGTETYKIQELHLPLYHYICAAAEHMRFAL